MRRPRPARLVHPDGTPLDGLSLDAMGCLVRLVDPVPALVDLARDLGLNATADAVSTALRAEVRFYRRHHLEGRDVASLRELHRACTAVFVDGLRSAADDGGLDAVDRGPDADDGLDAVDRGPDAADGTGPVDDAIVDRFVAALRFALLPGVADELERLDAAGVPMVCVSNWDCGLPGHLEALGVADRFRAIVPSGAVGYDKPDPRIFAVALDALGLPAARVAHLGDEAVDRDGARAAGMPFLDPPVAGLATRLGVGVA
ncbi:MAG: HAD-IA family hydrolase [Solirubrobacteraceae bacterium]|nr:HAD-IA family hydrolase [Solirubrobacteraceae bacterium]